MRQMAWHACVYTLAGLAGLGCVTGTTGSTDTTSSSSSSSSGDASSQDGSSSSAEASSSEGPSSAAASSSSSTGGASSSANGASSSSSSGGGCNPEAPVCTPACDSTEFCNSSCSCELLPAINELARDSRATAIDINKDDSLIIAANRDVGSVSIFNAATNTVTSRVTNLPDARNVVFHPDGTTFFVSHRNGVTRVRNANTVSPSAENAVPVCGEPYGLALSPSGARLYVACMDGVVVLVDTTGSTLSATSTVNLRGAAAAVGGNLPTNAAPVAIAVTNNRNNSDSDERVVVPLFYYERVPVASPADVDVGGLGVVAVLDPAGAIQRRIDLDPEADTGFGTGAFFNQLSSVWVQDGVAYVLALAAAPKGLPGPGANITDAGAVVVPAGGRNVFPYLLVLDVATGSELARHNLNGLMHQKSGDLRYLSVPSGIAFVPGTRIGYITSVASDAAVRIRLNTDGTLNNEAGTGGFGSTRNNFITLGKAPAGITISHGTNGVKGYVIHEVSRDLKVINFADQAAADTQPSEPLPTAGSNDEKRLNGKRFFITSIARWGNNGMVGCLACHPGNGALSDNVTWYFAAGPRQTVAMDSMFGTVGDVAGGMPNPDDQRALNWTAIFDELHDFELNTRGVSGGVGAIVSSLELNASSRINLATAGPGGQPAQFLRNSAKQVVRDVSVDKDWDAIELWTLGIRTPSTPPAPRANQASIDRGRQLFQDGNCMLCHAGSKWTISRVPYDPLDNTGGTLAAERAHATNYTSSSPFNSDTTVIAGDDAPAGVTPAPSLERIGCVVRDVGTYGLRDGGVDPFEIRQDMAAANAAQGANGFNPPSLLGVRYGAPFLHNGSVDTLTELFDPAFDLHTTAGNPNFLANEQTRAQDVADLVAFLESIDDTTPVFPIPSGAIICPTVP